MASTFRTVPIVFTISSFEFHQVKYSNCRDFIAKDAWPAIHPTSIHWIIRLGGKC